MQLPEFKEVRHYMANAQMWIIVVIYLIVTIGVGIIAVRREEIKNAQGYFNSTFSPLVMAFAITGTSISGSAFIGTPGTITQMGIPMWVWANMGGLVGIIVANWVLGKPMRRFAAMHDKITVTDMLIDIFKEPKIRYAAVPSLLVLSVANASIQWVAIGTLCSGLMGVSYETAVVIGVIVVALYTIAGGNKSTAVVSTVQIGIAMLAALYFVIRAFEVYGGGIAQLHNDLAAVNPEFVKVSNQYFPPMLCFSYFFTYGIGVLGQPHIIVKFFQIKDEKLLPKAMFFSNFSMFCTFLVPIAIMVLTVKLHAGEIPPLNSADSAIPTFIASYCGPFAGGILVAACLSAIMSTGAPLLITSSSTLVNDIMQNWLNINCSGKKGVRYARGAMTIIILISLYFAMNPMGGIAQMSAAAWGGFGAIFGPAITAGVRWRRTTKQGALASMWSGFLIICVFTILLESSKF
jgi:Na+/proline symporter